MISRAFSAIAVMVCALAVNSSAALAAGSDPRRIGDNAEKIVAPVAKSFWWIALVVGTLAIAASRKSSRAAPFAVFMVVSGIVLYNPAGVGSFMQGLADSLV